MSLGQSRVRGVLSIVGCIACAAAPAHAQLQPSDELTPVIGGLSLGTGVVAVSSRPAAVLDAVRGPWRRLGPVAMGLGAEALKGWAAFAKELGYEPREGFDALTSGGLAVVVVPPANGATVKKQDDAVTIEADPHWAVVSVVKSEVAARVREKLKASPHGVVRGLAVLSVEEGRFALVCRALTDKEGGDEVLALTPIDDQPFLESVVAAVEGARPDAVPREGAAPTLASTRAFALGQKTTADVLVLASAHAGNEEDTKDAKAADWNRATVIACTLGPRAWTFDATSADGEGTKRGAGRLPPEASAWFDAWSQHAAAMVVGSGFREIVEAVEAADPASAESLQRLKGVEAAGLFVGPSVAKADAQAGGAVGSRGGGGLAVWGALRVRERRLLNQAELDGAGCAVATAVEQDWRSMFQNGATAKNGKEGKDAASPAAFAHTPDTAPRFVTIGLAPGNILTGNAVEEIPGVVAWFRTTAPNAGPVAPESAPDWAVMSVEPLGELDAVGGRQESLRTLLAAAPAKESERAWVWRAVARPARLLAGLPMPLGLAVGVSGVGAVNEVRFETWDQGADGRHTRIVIEWTGGGGGAPAKP